MTPITVDELPDFLEREFPGSGLTCIADFTRDAIAIRKGANEVALYPESLFESDKVTEEQVRSRVATWLKSNG